MKRQSVFLFILAILLCACGTQQAEEDGTLTWRDTFSYEEDLECYGGGLGVRTSGFLNTEPVPVATKHQAVELVRRECKTDYPEFHVSHDPETGMWCVAFYLGEKVLDGGESVYLDSNGITKMILSGE